MFAQMKCVNLIAHHTLKLENEFEGEKLWFILKTA
ncbi:hypothetical protein SAMN06265349_104163 [Flavobacterium resistens]|uniref:Uncharacterized protein n=1 Tax=Flavobacterium resistens TaxID=443612 RepID=A0A521E7R4_9FLAO|nr:hypothetical protein SAMN06265349_104163 [Flavobacterium resistens]